MSSEAIIQVLQTPELLEQILSYLPPLQLLRIQRVAQLWNGTVSYSPELQRLLFMRPDWRLEAKAFDPWREVNKPGERPKNNRMLRRVLDGAYPTVTLKVTDSNPEPPRKSSDQEMTSDGTLMSEEAPSDGAFTPARRRSAGHWSWDLNISYPADHPPHTDLALQYEKASWRRMYLSQPPCTALHLVRRWQRTAEPVLENPEGIKMGEFVDVAAKLSLTPYNRLFKASDGDWHFEAPIKCSRYEEQAERNGQVRYDN
ncbi:hypothetical protein M8818_003957 [Zalaria obscura]|uniref:Uncharacterized protein n=1 Tax=Zalaria obscura TaxID=2024903 RepID=A0ACC3SD44_9PEZI